jgi:hypothetical protein
MPAEVGNGENDKTAVDMRCCRRSTLRWGGSHSTVHPSGFDIRQHALSLLNNGELGWIQIANFAVREQA